MQISNYSVNFQRDGPTHRRFLGLNPQAGKMNAQHSTENYKPTMHLLFHGKRMARGGTTKANPHLKNTFAVEQIQGKINSMRVLLTR